MGQAIRTLQSKTTATNMKKCLTWISLLASCTAGRAPMPSGPDHAPGWEQVDDVPVVLPALPEFLMSCGPAERVTSASPDEAALFSRVGPGLGTGKYVN